MKNSSSGWTQYQKLVLKELERHSEVLSSLDKGMGNLKLDIAMLKVKAGVWGLLAGLIPVVVLFCVELLKH